MPAFDSLQRASFAGLEFPVEEISIDGGLRDHVHEYPHAPGGAPELLGRKLYTFRLRAKFHNTFRYYGTDLWPRRWNRLRNIFEAGRVEDLVVPTLGTLKAYAFGWPETATSRQRSGVTVDLSFREYVDTYFLNGLLDVDGNAMQQAQQRLSLMTRVFAQTPPGQLILGAPRAAASAVLVPPPSVEKQGTLDLLGMLEAAFDAVFAVGDQAELASTMMEVRVLRVIELCKELDRRASMQDPRNARLRQALRAAWASVDGKRRDISSKRERLISFTTPVEMSITDVSIAIYGDTSRTMEILRLNALRDPFMIPKGSALRAYRPEPRKAA